MGYSSDENRLIRDLNEAWSKASFGYPIHEDLRIASSVAEMLRTESMKDVDKDAEKNAGSDKNTRELLRLSVVLYHWPEILSEYERLSRE